MALMTAAEARVYLRISGTAEDTTIETLISRFDSLAAAWCGFPAAPGGAVAAPPTLESASYTLYLDGPTLDPLTLDLCVRPVSAVASIYDDPLRAYGSDELVASGDYNLHGASGLVILTHDSTQGQWSTGYRAIKATVTAGWASGDAPTTIKHACGLQVAHWWRGRDSVGKTSVSQAGTSVSLRPLTLLPEVMQALGPFMLMGGSYG